MGAARLFLLSVAAALVAVSPLAAEPTDIAVKAAFLPRFARYVTWPAAAMPRGSDPFVLCIIGADPFGGMIDEAARSQLVDGRKIEVRRMDSAAGVDGCQIAFVSADSDATSSLIEMTNGLHGYLHVNGGKPVIEYDAGEPVLSLEPA